MSDETPVLLETTPEGVATVTLNRPALHNAFNEELIEQLSDVFDDLGKQDGIRVVIVQGAGPSFSAGADLNWMRRAADYDEAANIEDAGALGLMLRRLYGMPKPTIALVQGAAIAGGTGLVAACDVAVAVRSTRFSLSEVKLGLLPAMISPYLVAAMGPRQAHRYFLTAERFTAEEACRIGLVHMLVEDQAGLAQARDRLVGHFLQAAPGAVAETKDLIRTVTDRPIDADLMHETVRRIAARRVTAEGREGIGAFLEKRPPNWVVPMDGQG